MGYYQDFGWSDEQAWGGTPDDYDETDPDRWCHYCGGEGWGIVGTDFSNDDPVNDPDGEVRRCPCCGGSGLAKDCWFW